MTAVGYLTSVAVPAAVACLGCGRLDCDAPDPIACVLFAHPLSRRSDIRYVLVRWRPMYERDRRRWLARRRWRHQVGGGVALGGGAVAAAVLLVILRRRRWGAR